jgi:hypothetical protein
MTDIQQDLHDVRALLEQGGSEDEKKKYRKAAEIILLKTIRVDPENAEAKMLMQSVRGVQVSIATPVQAPPPSPPTPPSPPAVQPTSSVQYSATPPQKIQDEELKFTATASPLFGSLEKGNKKSRSKVLSGLILVLALGGGLVWIGQTHGMGPSRPFSPASKTKTVPQSKSAVSSPAQPQVLPSPVLTQVAASVPAQTVATPAPAAVPPAAALGKLTVSSPTTAEIYQGDKRLASTPATLELPVGRQTLEYRHGDLRNVLSYDIKADQTINASVTFQTTVQVNAKPWANVFVDGPSRRALGQTPLSGVSIPIGSVLVFENPNFQTKTHRVTDSEAAIQVDFP